jgi:hypothetical protein
MVLLTTIPRQLVDVLRQLWFAVAPPEHSQRRALAGTRHGPHSIVTALQGSKLSLLHFDPVSELLYQLPLRSRALASITVSKQPV